MWLYQIVISLIFFDGELSLALKMGAVLTLISSLPQKQECSQNREEGICCSWSSEMQCWKRTIHPYSLICFLLQITTVYQLIQCCKDGRQDKIQQINSLLAVFRAKPDSWQNSSLTTRTGIKKYAYETEAYWGIRALRQWPSHHNSNKKN